MRAPTCHVWQAPSADTSLEGRAASFPRVPPLQLPQNPLSLLIHPIPLRWDEGSGHSTAAWPVPRGVRQLCLCLLLTGYFNPWNRAGVVPQPQTPVGLGARARAVLAGQAPLGIWLLANGCPSVTGLGTAMPPCRVYSINPQLLESRDGGK